MYVVYVGKCLRFDSVNCMHFNRVFLSNHGLIEELLMGQVISKAKHGSF